MQAMSQSENETLSAVVGRAVRLGQHRNSKTTRGDFGIVGGW